jgi:hypothetical protein
MARPVTARETRGSAGCTCESFPSLYSSCVTRVSCAQAASSIAVPFRATRLNRGKLDVGLRQLAGVAEILLFPPASKQTGFAMFPSIILSPRFYIYTLQ